MLRQSRGQIFKKTLNLFLSLFPLVILVYLVNIRGAADYKNGIPETFPTEPPDVKSIQTPETEIPKHIVKRVIDGDTIVLENNETVRYIGMDAPEAGGQSECFSKEATNKNKELVEGLEIQLEKDKSETDRYGRFLRYVWIEKESRRELVNEILIREGFALAKAYPPDTKYQELLSNAQREATENSFGLWAACN